jgi:hypothetical protein
MIERDQGKNELRRLLVPPTTTQHDSFINTEHYGSKESIEKISRSEAIG